MKSQYFAQNRKKPKQKFRFWGPDVLLGPAAAVFRAAGTSKPRILTRASRSTRQFLFAPEALNEKGISVWIEARHRFVKTSVFPVRPKPEAGKLSRTTAWNFLPWIWRRRRLILCRSKRWNAGRALWMICCRTSSPSRQSVPDLFSPTFPPDSGGVEFDDR